MQREFQETSTRYSEVKQSIEQLNIVYTKMAQGLNDRVKRWTKFRNYLSVEISNKYSHNLEIRGFTGKLEFNHEEQTLDVFINTQKGSSKMSSIKDASGGERSYATVSLILALWGQMETPFRALDEFDVFMDAVNRRVTLNLLLEGCRDQGGQFLFSTPQEVSVVSSDLRMHKLNEPIRGTQESTTSNRFTAKNLSN